MDLTTLTVEEIGTLTLDQATEASQLKKADGRGRLYHHFTAEGRALKARIDELSAPPEPEIEATAEVSEAASEATPVASGAITGREFMYRVLVNLAASEEGRKDFHWIWSGMRKPYQAFMVVNRLLDEWGLETPPYLPSVSELNLDRATGEPIGQPVRNGAVPSLAPQQPVAPNESKDLYDQIAELAGGRRGSQASGPSTLQGNEGFSEVHVPKIRG